MVKLYISWCITKLLYTEINLSQYLNYIILPIDKLQHLVYYKKTNTKRSDSYGEKRCHYVDNAKFLQAMKDWKEQCKDTRRLDETPK